ncbi:MAG: hypothetical protein AAGF94_02810 [Pseudomonadota bacterium]
MAMVPGTYEEWEHCITVECGIPLTAQYVEERIQALENESDHHTQKFIDRWGRQHHAQTLGWFRQAEERLRQ